MVQAPMNLTTYGTTFWTTIIVKLISESGKLIRIRKDLDSYPYLTLQNLKNLQNDHISPELNKKTIYLSYPDNPTLGLAPLQRLLEVVWPPVSLKLAVKGA